MYTLELFHVADQEASTSAVIAAPNFSAVLNALRDADVGDDGAADNTLFLSSGDAYIPGLFFSASEAAYGSGGIADIEIQNQLGVQAIALGNHEFDFGTDVLAGLIDGTAVGDVLDSDFAGANFPYLSTNLDFSTDDNLAPLEVSGGAAPVANSVTSSVVIDVNGDAIGVVGATTPTLDVISSPGDLTILPADFDGIPTGAQLDALAAEIQAEVDALLAANQAMNKVILLAHMQRIDIELALAERLTDVDIIVAGGSNTRLFDDNDHIIPGDSDQGEYPQFVTNAGGTETVVVNTDGSYKYLGRLVIDFDDDGNVIADSYDADVSGAYATDAGGLLAVTDGLPTDLELSEAQEVAPVADTAATGSVSVTAFDPDTLEVTISGTYSGLTSALTPVGGVDSAGNVESAIHLHAGDTGENGGILRNFTVSETDAASGSFTGTFTLTEFEALSLLKGETYVNVHTVNNAGGELRGQIEFSVNDGATTLGELFDPEIQEIADDIAAQIVATESNVFGVSDVFLNGNRSGGATDGVRTQETNLGNLTADANLAIAQSADESVLVSIKNGGGIRASIGETVVQAGATEATRVPSEEVVDGQGNVIKPEGGISQNDIETTLAFNNGLTLLTLTRQELVDVLEHGIASVPGVSGRFPQVSGVQFAFDETRDAGERITSAAIVDDNGVLIDRLVENGELVGDGTAAVRIVTLSFLAGGGDGYPFPQGDSANRVDLFADGTRTGDATFADDFTEQDALAEYLSDKFATSDFDQLGTPASADLRIQQTAYRTDEALRTTIAADDFDGNQVNVLDDPLAEFLDGGPGDAVGAGSLNIWPGSGGVPFSLVDSSLDGFAGDTEAVFGAAADGDNVFFGVSDTRDFGDSVEVRWTFDISNAEDLRLAIDLGAMSDGDSFGGFSGETTARFGYSIDGGAVLSAFDIAVATDIGAFEFRPMDIGTDVTEGNVLEVSGASGVTKVSADTGLAVGNTLLDRASLTTGNLDTFLTDLAGTGNELELIFTANVPFEAMAFDNIRITGNDLLPGDGGAAEPVPAGEMLVANVIDRLDLAGAEIVDFDPSTDRGYVTSGSGVQIIDMSDPTNLSLISTIDPTVDGFNSDEVTSVSVGNGILAMALPDANEQLPGHVVFYDLTGTFIGSVQVGALPDMVTFDATGNYVLVANEGESAGDDNEASATPNPEGSVSVIDITNGVANATVTTLGFTDASLTAEALRAKDVRIFDDAPSVAADIEPEYITIDGTTAYIALQENNAVAIIDDITNPTAFTIDDIIGLGAKDHALDGNKLDASDKDDAINLQNYPVKGLYMPDGLASFTANGTQYFVTANEGDARGEDERIADIVLDPTAFPNAAELQADDVLGRLEVSTIDGDIDGDGDFDELFAYGARSFTIWDQAGNVVFDSGDEFARIIATEAPEVFNANDSDPDKFDSRSDAKGAEPESVVVGEVDGTFYAFIGLERTGGVMVYDITDPANAAFDRYIQIDGDVAPEGLKFISASDSPTGNALLAIANEDSNTLSVVEFNATTAISAVQGAGAESALVGQTVIVEGIVTGDFQTGDTDTTRDLDGFFLMEEVADRDADDATSEGIFIFEGDTLLADVALGDTVKVTGTVVENSGQTMIVPTHVTLVEAGTVADISTLAVTTDLPDVDDREALEGMLVTLDEPLTLVESFDFEERGHLTFAADGPIYQYTQQNAPDSAGNAAYQQDVANRTIRLEDGLSGNRADGDPIYLPNGSLAGFADGPRMGQSYSDLTGIIDVSLGAYTLRLPENDSFVADTDSNPRPASPADVGGSLKVASLNVLNYFTTINTGGNTTDLGAEPRGAETAEEFARQEQKLVQAVLEMDADIVGLIELENDFAGDVFAIDSFVTALNTAAGGSDWAYVDPGQEFVGDDTIAVGFIYDTSTVSLNGDAAILDAASFLDPLDDGDDTNGDETPNGDSWNRAAVAQTFEEIASGESFTAVVNHFKSKGSLTGAAADADQGDGAGRNNATREAASSALAAWLATDPTGTGETDALILGDLNAYANETPITTLEAAGYTDLANQFEGDDVYSYRFSGQLGTLDYALANDSLFFQVTGAASWNINSDEPVIYDYNTDGTFTSTVRPTGQGLFDGTNPARNSDHDPIIVGLSLGAGAPSDADDDLDGTDANNVVNLEAGDDTYKGGAGDDDIDGGAGTDTAEFDGNSTAFTLRLAADEIRVTDRAGTEGSDTLANIENIVFADQTIPLDLLVNAPNVAADDLKLIIELYIGYLDRAPDAFGLAYWASQFADGLSLEDMADAFFASPEAQARFDTMQSTGEYVDAAYQAVWGRAADDAGRAFWIDVLDTGAVGFEELPAALISGAKAPSGGASDAANLAAKVAVAERFAVENGLTATDDATDVLNLLDMSGQAAAEALVDTFAADAAVGDAFLVEIIGAADDPFMA